jgi:hypothetical protein
MSTLAERLRRHGVDPAWSEQFQQWVRRTRGYDLDRTADPILAILVREFRTTLRCDTCRELGRACMACAAVARQRRYGWDR